MELIEAARSSTKECPTLFAAEFTAILFSQGDKTVHRSRIEVVRSIIHGCIALLLASNYFAFQIELFDDEYDENHPLPSATCSITHPTLTWESFDKDNALQAFSFNPEIFIQLVDILPSVPPPRLSLTAPSHPIRDKSPPEILVQQSSIG